MNFEQPNIENTENYLEKEHSQEELVKIGETVLKKIEMIKETISNLEKRRSNIVENVPEGEDYNLNPDFKYIESTVPAFRAKLESLEELTGQD
jgi:DNA replication initiation complex subunit (GINS family)